VSCGAVTLTDLLDFPPSSHFLPLNCVICHSEWTACSVAIVTPANGTVENDVDIAVSAIVQILRLWIIALIKTRWLRVRMRVGLHCTGCTEIRRRRRPSHLIWHSFHKITAHNIRYNISLKDSWTYAACTLMSIVCWTRGHVKQKQRGRVCFYFTLQFSVTLDGLRDLDEKSHRFKSWGSVINHLHWVANPDLKIRN